LIVTGVDEAVLRLASGEERAGEDLRKVVDQARIIRNLLNALHSRYNRQVVEQAAILGVLSSEIFGDPKKAKAAAPYIAKRLNALSEETERGWEGEFSEEAGFTFTRTLRGVKTVSIIDHALLGLADARKLDEYAASLQKIYEKPGHCVVRTKPGRFTGRSVCLRPHPVRDARRNNATLQRLGEMNPEQPVTRSMRTRSLLQVKEGEDAVNIFTELMGELAATPALHRAECARRQRGRLKRDRAFGSRCSPRVRRGTVQPVDPACAGRAALLPVRPVDEAQPHDVGGMGAAKGAFKFRNTGPARRRGAIRVPTPRVALSSLDLRRKTPPTDPLPEIRKLFVWSHPINWHHSRQTKGLFRAGVICERG
jgi:hypothetical protein